MRSAVLGTLRVVRVPLGAMRCVPLVPVRCVELPWLRAFWRARERAEEEESFGGRERGITLRGPCRTGLLGCVFGVEVEPPWLARPDRPLPVGRVVGWFRGWVCGRWAEG